MTSRKIAKIINVGRIPKKWVDNPNFKSPIKILHLGEAAGSHRIYANIDFVKPGAKSVKYHHHSKQEEFFLILEGTAILRINGKKANVKRGDFFAKPAGKSIAHQFINNGRKVLQILDVGLMESDDIVTYPDENVILFKKPRLAFKKSAALKNWSSDPN